MDEQPTLPQVKRMRQLIQAEWWTHIQSCSVCDGKIYLDGSAPCGEAERLVTELRRWSALDVQIMQQKLMEEA